MLIPLAAVAARTTDGFSFSFQRSGLSREEIRFGCTIEGELSLPKFERLLLMFSLLESESYPKAHRIHFCFLDNGNNDPDGLLTALESMPTAMRLPHLLVEIGEILLLRTRYGAGEVFKPDDRTHLISVFGSVDAGEDDWFASDFCLLQTALGGTAKTETHLACVDLKKFVTEHGPLLHGPPGRQRKVVFDQNSEVFYTQYLKNDLAEEFLKAIRLVSSNALAGERIVIVIVAHGESAQGNVYIGSNIRGKRIRVTRSQIEACLSNATAGVQITIVVTSCFSGFWTILYGRPTVDTAGKKPQRAVSIGDLGKTTQLVNRPFSQFEAFCQRIATRFNNHKIAKVPQFRVGESDRTLSASAVLGGNEELSTILRVEGILTLRPEDPFTCIGIGVENTYKAGGGDDVHMGSSSASFGRAALYMAEKAQAALIEGHPHDNHLIRQIRQLKRGALTVEQEQKLWKLLVWRSVRDAWAESIVRKFNTNFPSISVWKDEYSQNDGRFGAVLMDFSKDPSWELSSAPYSRPDTYIRTAAEDAGISPAQLRICLSGQGKLATNQRPPIRPRTSSLSGTTLYNMGNWSSLSMSSSSLTSVPFDLMDTTMGGGV
jgi:hypothetical protein